MGTTPRGAKVRTRLRAAWNAVTIRDFTTHQQEMGQNLDHNTNLTQESWGMISPSHYDWTHGTYYPQQSYPDPDQQY